MKKTGIVKSIDDVDAGDCLSLRSARMVPSTDYRFGGDVDPSIDAINRNNIELVNQFRETFIQVRTVCAPFVSVWLPIPYISSIDDSPSMASRIALIRFDEFDWQFVDDDVFGAPEPVEAAPAPEIDTGWFNVICSAESGVFESDF